MPGDLGPDLHGAMLFLPKGMIRLGLGAAESCMSGSN